VRAALAGLLAAAILAGCGGDDGAIGGDQGRVDDDRAAAEAGETKIGLDRALEKYREGDRSATAERVEQAREEHFALVEPALRDDDAALAAQLHRELYNELPGLIEDGVTVSELAERVAEVEVDLDDAVVKLRAP
jgi:hypothetical protein